MDELRRLLGKGNNFLALYLAVMLPTYILPYMGSNSLLAGVATLGATAPQFLLHLVCLIALCVFAQLRGKIIGKDWLVALPIGAGVFDMVPLLNWIPLVPTALHVVALVVGMKDDGDYPPPEDTFS
ncbi:MAG: hypothetical protein KDE32_14745 [Novosphingobium sp.]|nr:hypothetical protein [Novosphingobium sp.]